MNVTSAEVADISIAPKPPMPTILIPTSRAFVGPAESVDLLGQGYDVQDGQLPGTALQWLLDNNVVGSGETANTGALSVGIGLSASDPADAGGDLDQDGVVNWQEYELGSDPRNPQEPGLHSTHEIAYQPGGGELLPPLPRSDGATCSCLVQRLRFC